ncbi:hypothetical protein [Desulforamulus ruminis]|uniref:hypothetical protein n=1 Tax=Desulforamulus ruminis TaxID=1564 RepID=UPI00235594F6|nr:hypothetical protein [Desulforamulus ruminis]
MDKVKIRELFELLLADFEQSEDMVIHERGCTKDYEELEKRIAEYRKKLNELLE